MPFKKKFGCYSIFEKQNVVVTQKSAGRKSPWFNLLAFNVECFEITFERVASNREEVSHPHPIPDIENILRQNNVEKCIVWESNDSLELEEFSFLWTILNDLQIKNIIIYKNSPERIHCYFTFIATSFVFSYYFFFSRKESESNEIEFESSKIFIYRKGEKLFTCFLTIIEKALKYINNFYINDIFINQTRILSQILTKSIFTRWIEIYGKIDKKKIEIQREIADKRESKEKKKSSIIRSRRASRILRASAQLYNRQDKAKR